MPANNLPLSAFAPPQDWSAHPLWKAVRFRWYWFVLSPLAFALLAQLFLRYKTPRYSINASLLIRDDSRGGNFRETALLEELGLPDVSSSVENEIEILKSRTLIAQVIADLNLTTQYFASGRLKTAELYEKAPFKVKFLNRALTRPATCHITWRGKNAFTVHTANGKINGTFGKRVALPQGLAVIDTTRFKPAPDDQYAFSVAGSDVLLEQYATILSVQAPNKTASLVNISVQDVLPRRGEAFLKQLIHRYQQANIDDQNKVADNTIAFINHNLGKVSAELLAVEAGIERFRRQHKVINMAESGRLAIQKMLDNGAKEKELAIHLKVIGMLEAHLRENASAAIPTSLYPQDRHFSDLVAHYNDMQLRKARASASLAIGHPEIESIDNQITIVRNNLFNAIAYQKRELAFSLAQAHAYAREFDLKTAAIPGDERQFLSQSREQGIQQDLYLFLLKKRMETAISRSANVANARVIDAPKASALPGFPNRQLTFLIALFSGILAPLATLYVRQIFNNRITSREDILLECDIPIIGEISEETGSARLMKRDNRSLVREQCRTLRTNIQFITGMHTNQVILLTSAMANEGKSFVATHLAQSLALTGKKILLIDFDLRKPTLAHALNQPPEGVTEAIVFGTEPRIHPLGNPHRYDFLAAGQLHPGAGELLLSPKVGELVSTLKTRYDYVLLDSPPAGLVADARLLGRLADMTLCIVRQHFTFKHQLENIRRWREESQLPDIYIVLNGTRELHNYQYNYY
ncbi:tyrosine protein kinase [Dyadobacter beijingensis]|uniref:Tyrosine protein kinase n=1 Tax=Dyadobacter beijingensis TaxID=365489 RepID=A0ABQ2IGL4_9BACT|nr:tyrosine-protein kinase [Dyadobacter beijingensis]GGN10594.1 tyrosine protein kinase [Dyadobacter beijingensis]